MTMASPIQRELIMGNSYPAAMTADGKRLRTVVVDDSPTFLEVVCALLELEEEIDVLARAADGVSALEVVADLRPDLLVMDIDMPYLDGLNAAMLISTRFPRTRIVLMSADDSPELRADCLACGADAFVHKPQFRKAFSRALSRMQLC
jgi:two-component system, NarL family, nitrate/nitrite response regulator NarL